MKSVKEYLETYICKVGESIQQVNKNEWEIQKWTARTYRVLGNVWTADDYDVHPPEAIVKLNLKPNSRKTAIAISEDLKQKALGKGWIIQEIRFKSDGRTPDRTMYRMGLGLAEYERLKRLARLEETDLMRQAVIDELNNIQSMLPELFVQQLTKFAFELKDEENWSKERVRKFTEFLLAYLRLRERQPHMDYKEIGATYFKRIGGSKAFDAYRNEFIARIEKWIDAPIREIGIVSTGSIVPIHFTGNVAGNLSSYALGTVHSTTEIAVMDDVYTTSAKVLWLVENRAVLTRMAKEVEFLKETSSLVIGVDGQIRGAHRKFIQQLCLNSSIQRLIIWVDYDEAGKVIARELMNLAEGISVRFVGTEGNIFTAYSAYIEWTETICDAEQEMTLGGPDEWRKWISQ